LGNFFFIQLHTQDLRKALEEFTAQKKAREDKVKGLEAKAEQGGVKGKAAANELKQMENEDTLAMNKLEVTLEAAKKRAMKDSGKEALDKKKKEV
jgi:hypothetical protein